MNLRNLLLGTTALLGAGLLGAAAPGSAQAAEVKPGGALDVTISGFARFRAHFGDLDAARLDDTVSTGLDFSNDTEVHVILRGKHDASGLEYGGTVEFEADTNRTDNTDESWLFVRGGFGEIRLGDEDGVTDNSAVGAQTIAAGTGGIDGSVIDAVAVGVVYLTNSNDATKIRYYTPSFGGFQAGVSYTPNQVALDSGGLNGDLLAPKDVTIGDLVEAGLVYDGEFGGLGFQASVVGSVADVKSEDAIGGDDFYGIAAGVATEIFGFKVAGAYGTEEVGALEKQFFNVGVGYGIGPVNFSVNYGQAFDTEGYLGDDVKNLVFSADLAVAPGLVLAGDLGFFDNDVDGDDTDAIDNDADGNSLDDDSGYQAVIRLGLAF